MRREINISHYRYKASEISTLYKIAKDYLIDPDKFIVERHDMKTHLVQTIKAGDIFPRGGITVCWDNKGNSSHAVCSLKDNYDRCRGVNICMGRLAKFNPLPF